MINKIMIMYACYKQMNYMNSEYEKNEFYDYENLYNL